MEFSQLCNKVTKLNDLKRNNDEHKRRYLFGFVFTVRKE